MATAFPFIATEPGAVTSIPCWEPIAARWVTLEITAGPGGRLTATAHAMENPPAPPEEFKARH
jgi:hypothetical protein